MTIRILTDKIGPFRPPLFDRSEKFVEIHAARVEPIMLVGERPFMKFTLEVEEETDGRWIAEVPELPGTLVYGATQKEAIAKAKALALRVVADQLEHGETAADPKDIYFTAA